MWLELGKEECCEETDLDSRRGSSRKPPDACFSLLASPLAPSRAVHRILKPMAKSILVCIPIFLGDFGKNSLLGINNIHCKVILSSSKSPFSVNGLFSSLW